MSMLAAYGPEISPPCNQLGNPDKSCFLLAKYEPGRTAAASPFHGRAYA
jgi:hypothetical protein